VRGLTHHAPEIVQWLRGLGVPFALDGYELDLRAFGGQKKRRTVYAKSSTGKMVMTALIDEVRKHEASGLVRRLPHHELEELLVEGGQCVGCSITDLYTGEQQVLRGPVILACGGLNGFFGDAVTGTTQNTGGAAAKAFQKGVAFGNMEMIQYHPTTVRIPGKRLLVSEAARGEGGRLYVRRDGSPWYFMETMFPEMGNLAPRDVVTRTMTEVSSRPDCGEQVYLDLRGLSDEVWQEKLPDLREEIREYLSLDPAEEPIPVEPGIHYFMGGVLVDEAHRASLPGLFAAGECACQYHGANRLGGNSMLGALYGGKIAARSALDHHSWGTSALAGQEGPHRRRCPWTAREEEKLHAILGTALGVIRDGAALEKAAQELEVMQQSRGEPAERITLALAMVCSASARRESRGAHNRRDFPEQREELRKTTAAEYRQGKIEITFQEIPLERGQEYGEET
jgi:succinate dehydrogenase / fumarate reductase flavoprotein subunit